jgi:hypothetical protein
LFPLGALLDEDLRGRQWVASQQWRGVIELLAGGFEGVLWLSIQGAPSLAPPTSYGHVTDPGS